MSSDVGDTCSLCSKALDRRTYLESLNLIFQHDFHHRQAAELVCVNVRGLPGKSIPNNLHIINRLVKTSLKGLGANKTEKANSTIGKILGVIQPVLQSFDTENWSGGA